MDNEWGTVCDDFWGSADATVVCRQLGHSTQGQWHIPPLIILNLVVQLTPTDAVAFSYSHFGRGVGPIYLDNIDCTGSESNLTDCSHSSFASCYYGHSEDAGVRCQG